jgi:ABC-type enterobactin transport system permease subunit
MAPLVVLDLDPSIVKPGWTPLIIVLLLAVVMVFLFMSMRRQFRKIRVGQDAARDEESAASPSSPDGSA